MTPLPQKIKNDFLTWPDILARFERDIVAWQRSGFKLADTGEHARRFNICKLCDHYKRFTCTRCRCIIYIKSKLEALKCPINKW